MDERFRALRVYQLAAGSEARLESLMLDDLSGGEVVIRTRWAGVNFKDSLAVSGRAKVLSGSPRVPGIEFVGVVESSASSRFAVGDDVLVHGFDTGIAFDGGFAARARVPAEHVMPMPEGLAPRDAAVLGVPAFSAAIALDRFQAAGITPASGPVAVSGASGAVGMAAIALLARAGYEVVALSRRPAWSDALRRLGAARVVAIDEALAATRPLERATFAAAIDNVGGPVLSWLLRSLKERGQLAAVGNASGIAFSANVLPFILRGATLFGVVANAPWPVRQRLWARLAGDWRPDLSALAAHVGEIDLDDLPTHCAAQVDGRVGGRTLVRFDA